MAETLFLKGYGRSCHPGIENQEFIQTTFLSISPEKSSLLLQRTLDRLNEMSIALANKGAMDI